MNTLKLVVLVVVALLVGCADLGMSVAGSGKGTPTPTTDVELHTGERFTVVCVDAGSVITYGDNGNENFPATAVAGFCE